MFDFSGINRNWVSGFDEASLGRSYNFYYSTEAGIRVFQNNSLKLFLWVIRNNQKIYNLS